MLTKVEVVTATGLVLELPIATSPGGYLVQDIDGLDPNKAIYASSILSQMDGEEYQSSRGEKRQITLELGYSKGHPSTVRARRTNLYTYMMPQSRVTLRFYMTDFPVVEIVAHVETVDAPMFTKDPKATIIFVCFKPDFISQTLISLPGFTTDVAADLAVVYGGSIKSGFDFDLMVNRSISGFTLTNSLASGEQSQLSFSGALISGDVVTIDTREGQNGAWRTRASVKASVLNSVSPSSEWPDLNPGGNSIRVYAAGAPIPFTIEYKERFGGL